jgi:predicted metal-dependent HD superfamily phosphohydrolase
MSPSPPLVLPAEQWDTLREAYRTPPRSYHDWAHVERVLQHYEAVATGPGWTHPEDVFLAVLYHDACYEPASAANEARSAALAVAHIARWLPDAGIDAARVERLIGLTARHGEFAPADLGAGQDADDARHFLDCDMAVLGAPPAEFDAYNRGIAAEFRGLAPGWLFNMERRRFLKSLLARERIYLSAFFHARLDGQARGNLRRVLATKQ